MNPYGETMKAIVQYHLRSGYPDFLDLPWHKSITEWDNCCANLEELPRGLSRHPVVFANYAGTLFAIKELPAWVAENEYNLLLQIEELRLPAVTPVGFLRVKSGDSERSILITRYLDNSLPYRSLFMQRGLVRYQDALLDAMAGLLVQLHLAGVFWGDCSLSNTLFRRDAGTLQAYLVDAETAEVHPPRLSPTLRHHELEIMEENVDGDLRELTRDELIDTGFPILEFGSYIRRRYQSLWEEITREQIISPDEHYRIQERIRALNLLGFSVGEVEMQATENGNKLRLRVMVTDRNFHRDQLMDLTGLEAEEMQARQMMNEILQLRATLTQDNNRSTPLAVAAYHWLQHYYQPVIERLAPKIEAKGLSNEALDLGELYFQVLEHKWYMSERAKRDVGHMAAVEDFLAKFGPPAPPTSQGENAHTNPPAENGDSS